ncbi:MAG TPA: extracellular solute-binding protein, partial [Verrucomicrobiae bacterium]|nr:extracellular solute-binding protein [Verrucomicrobiae bacterium]
VRNAECGVKSARISVKAVILSFAAILFAIIINLSCASKIPVVIVYTSQDEVYAEPIFKDFEKQTGIQVRPVYDSEAVKTVGLANRLLAEASHPQCDVFWNNEEFRTRELAARNIFRETNGWAALGYRTRRLVINTNLLPLAKAPKSFNEVTNEIWRGKVALAYPLFGTTATHFLALRQHWGDERWQTWCRALAANKPFLVDGNSVVVKLVARGEAWLGFTDSDDIAAEAHEGSPVAALPVNEETLFIFNTVGVIRDAPHPAAAQKLFEFLQSREVSRRLVEANALEAAALDPATAASGLKVDWNSLLRDLEAATDELKKIFLR